MSILYVIGNGFDIAHGLRTSYWNFREFLEEHDWQFLENFEKLYGLPQIDENDPYTNVTAWRNHIYDYLWGSLEEKMSLVDTVDIVNMSDSITGQLDLDGGNWGIEDTKVFDDVEYTQHKQQNACEPNHRDGVYRWIYQ